MASLKKRGKTYYAQYYVAGKQKRVCPALELKNEKISTKGQKKPTRKQVHPIEANHFEQITTADIASFISAKMRSKKLSPKTANRFREIITRLFNWAMQNHGIRTPDNLNPAAKVERYKEKAPQITFLSKDHIKEQLEALVDDHQLQTMTALYIYAGLRREEALWLTHNDVDLNQGMIRIRAKTIDGESWQPKTGVNRVVPISRTLRTYLEDYQRPKTKQPWLFLSPQLSRWDPDNFSKKLRNANNSRNLEWSCLDYRHTFGSQLAMKGESLYKISKLMGNSPEICRKHYAAILPETLVDTVEF